MIQAELIQQPVALNGETCSFTFPPAPKAHLSCTCIDLTMQWDGTEKPLKNQTCCPLIVATGIVGACGMLLSMVTVTCPGTFVGAERVEGGAGAMGRLGMVGFKGGYKKWKDRNIGNFKWELSVEAAIMLWGQSLRRKFMQVWLNIWRGKILNIWLFQTKKGHILSWKYAGSSTSHQ